MYGTLTRFGGALHMQYRCLLLASVVTLSSVSGTALADEAADRATARALAGEGHNALLRRDFEQALDRFRRADALVHAPTLAVGIARSLAGLGRLVEAQEEYQRVIREGVAPSDPQPWQRALENARQELAQLKPRLAWLTVQVTGAATPAVFIDEAELPQAAIGVQRATNPGRRTVRVTAPGYVPVERTLTLAEGQRRTLAIELERDPAAVAMGNNASAAQAAPANWTSSAPITSEQPERSRTPAYVAFGVGGAGLVVGTVAGLLTLNAKSTLDEECPNDSCPPAEQDTLDRYRTYGTISALGFGVGVAGIATGTTLLLINGRADVREDRSSAGIEPFIGLGAVGATGRF